MSLQNDLPQLLLWSLLLEFSFFLRKFLTLSCFSPQGSLYQKCDFLPTADLDNLKGPSESHMR